MNTISTPSKNEFSQLFTEHFSTSKNESEIKLVLDEAYHEYLRCIANGNTHEVSFAFVIQPSIFTK